MCGRYSLSTPADLVAEVFAVDDPEELVQRWNIAPSEPAAVVRASAGGGRRLVLQRWGLEGDRAERRDAGARAAAAGRLLINARSETAATLPAFRDGFRARRCLVPADGFYEWGAGPRGRAPYHIRFGDRRLFAFAGIWDGLVRPGAPPLESFAILTCPPNELVGPLHDRMPVILPPEAWQEWLTGSDPGRLQALLAPWQGGGMEAVPVGPYVNRAGNEGPECLAPPPPPERPAQRTLFS